MLVRLVFQHKHGNQAHKNDHAAAQHLHHAGVQVLVGHLNTPDSARHEIETLHMPMVCAPIHACEREIETLHMIQLVNVKLKLCIWYVKLKLYIW